MEGRINVRMSSLNSNKIENSIKHDMRTRKDLQQVDYSKSDTNQYSHTPKQFREVYAAAKAEHKSLYKKVYGRNPQEGRVNALQEGIITFPAIYQSYYEEGKFSNDDLHRMFQKFVEKFEEESGLRVLSEFWHFDEKTLHVHFHTTNYIVRGDDAGKPFNPKGWKSYLQDIGGYAFADIGLRRGNPKSSKGKDRSTTEEHRQELLSNADAIEQTLSNDFTMSDLEELIKVSVKPLKTMLTYMHRAMNREREAQYIIQQEERAMNKFKQVFPDVDTVEDFNDLLDYIKSKPKGIDWNAVNAEKDNRRKR